MTPATTPSRDPAHDRAESDFVLALGGFVLEVPGARLVTHEKLPSPRFNFVELRSVGVDRQAALFERVLDHYFQRALRPEIRVRPPVAPHVDAALRRFGFLIRDVPHTRLVWNRARVGSPAKGPEIRSAEPSELDDLVALWTTPAEREEFRRSVQVAWLHPHPGESLTPLIAREGPAVVSAALVYSRDGVSGIHLVATMPAGRGKGAASALVRHAIESVGPLDGEPIVCAFVDDPRAETALGRLGFEVAAQSVVYELPASATLELPSPGPPQPPRWRPPR